MASSSPLPRIISCRPSHLPQLLSIYNYYVLYTVVTFHLTPQPLSFMEEIFSNVTAHKLPFLLLVNPPTTTTTTPSSSSNSSFSPSIGRGEEDKQQQQQQKQAAEKGEEEEEEEEGEVVGYAYLLPYNPHREAYSATTELSIFLAPQATRSGFGALLLKALLDKIVRRSKKKNEEFVVAERHQNEIAPRVREIVAGMSIFEGDPGRFYERMGFRPVGIFKRLGWKFDRLVDVKFFQLSLGEGGEED